MRRAAGLSQEELAEQAGLSRRGISDLERGQRRSPHPATVRQLAAALKLDAAQHAALLASARPEPTAALPPLALPIPLTSFIGRESEVAEVRRLLRSIRLLTLTGTGGIGKTRLAVHVAGQVIDDYVDGVRLVELASLGEPSSVARAVASAIGVREQPHVPLMTTLIGWLGA